MDWKDVYRELKKKGYSIALPKSREREKFRQNMQEQQGLLPIDSKTRAIYVLGNRKKKGDDFFDDKDLVAKLNKEVNEISKRIKGINPSSQFCAYKFRDEPNHSDLVARRLCASQGTIEFIDTDAYKRVLGVYVSWIDKRKN